MLELIFIGTGSAIESLNRFHSSFFIQTTEYNLLIDAGDCVSKALLKQKINYHSIDGIIFTHFHPDHFSGFGGLIIQMEFLQREKPLQIFTHYKLIPFVKNYLHLSYLFEKNIYFDIEFIGFNHNEVFCVCDKIQVKSKSNMHIDAYKKYDEDNKIFFSSSSFLFNLKGKKLFYTGDIGTKDDLYLFSEEKIDYMITEITHISIEDILEAVKFLQPSRLYLTHISDDDGETIEKIINQTSAFDVPTIEAVDGMKIII